MLGNLKSKAKNSAFFYTAYSYYLAVKIAVKKAMIKKYSAQEIQSTNLLSYDLAMEKLHELKNMPTFQEPDFEFKPAEVDVSIIIPIYNVEKYLAECLNSLKNQKTEHTYEVICIDDGSTDSSGNILDDFKDTEGFVIVHQENKGHSGARNTGIRMSKGRYIAFVDSDDFMSDDFIESCVRMAEENQADVVQTCYTKCNSESNKLKDYNYVEGTYTNFMDYIQFDGTPWGKLYRRQLWASVLFPDGASFEDTIIFNIILRRCRKLVVNTEARYYYRIHGNNTITKLQNTSKTLDSVYTIIYCLKLSDKLGIGKTADYYAFLLLQCSTHVRYRVRELGEEVQKYCFSVLCVEVEKYIKNLNVRITFEDIVLQRLDECFKNRDFELWKKCSDVFPSSNIQIKKCYKKIK